MSQYDRSVTLRDGGGGIEYFFYKIKELHAVGVDYLARPTRYTAILMVVSVNGNGESSSVIWQAPLLLL